MTDELDIQDRAAREDPHRIARRVSDQEETGPAGDEDPPGLFQRGVGRDPRRKRGFERREQGAASIHAREDHEAHERATARTRRCA